MNENEMNRYRTIFLTSMAVTLVAVIALSFLGDWRYKRINRGDNELRSALTSGLQDVLQRNDAIVAGMVGVKRTGSREEPEAVVLAKVGSGRSVEDLRSRYGSAAVPGEGLVEPATLAFFLDRDLVHAGMAVPTRQGDVPAAGYGYPNICPSELEIGQDSIFLLQALQECPRYLADWLAVCDRDRFLYAGYYLSSHFGDSFGDSDAFSIPRSQGESPGTIASIADGTGVRLSQGQVLRFYDAVANRGEAAGHRYVRSRRVCSEQTASLITAVLARNVASGPDSLSVRPAVRVAGKSAAGRIEAGTIPGHGKVGVLAPPCVSSFVGFFPADNPQYTMCVTLYSSPKGKDVAAKEAKGLFARIVNGMKGNGLL